MTRSYKYIYGPVPSWRLGSSLGIDPISKGEKVCAFDCAYCQLGETKVLSDKREIFIDVKGIVEELDSLPSIGIDYITFSGTGEPTLAANLGEMIKAVRKSRNEKIAVLTNSSLITREDVQNDLFMADLVVVKLDAPAQSVFKAVNRSAGDISINAIIKAVKEFRSCYIGKMALQVMFIEQNKKYAGEIARIAGEINPDEVQLNTPLRPCGVKPLTKPEMDSVEKYFNGLNTVSVYNAEKREIEPISSESTLKRRGKA